MLAEINASQIIVPLVVALIAAFGGLAVGWRRLTVLGQAERGKLEAEKQDIIEAAEDKATARALTSLQAALDVAERARERVERDLEAERRSRLELEATVNKNSTTITELHRRTRQLEQAATEAKATAYQSLLQTIPDAIVQAGPDGRVKNINQAALDLFGYRLTEIVDHPLTTLMPARYQAAHRAGFEAALATGTGPLIEAEEPTRLWALKGNGEEIEIALRLGAQGDIFTAVIRPWIKTRNGNGDDVPVIDPEG